MYMKVLSLFDGISCFRVALGDRKVEYLASEIDKNAIKISKKNYPGIQHLGSVCDLSGVTGVDILVGGSPCTDLSIAMKGRKGLGGDRSKLFYEYVRIWRECKPKWFILENVASMPEKDKSVISNILGVHPVMIDASLVSAQSRKRLFWTNIPIVGLPTDRGLKVKDVLEEVVDDKYVIKSKFTENKSASKNTGSIQVGHISESNGQANRVYSTEGKSVTLTALGGGSGAKTGLYAINNNIRKLTPVECERLMGLPDDYTDGVSMTARYKAIGNAFHVEIMKWILRFIPE
jgi:site-specific DNA-cytosine methylase